jgi:hypothetical protein
VGVFGESIYPIKWEGPSRKRKWWNVFT